MTLFKYFFDLETAVIARLKTELSKGTLDFKKDANKSITIRQARDLACYAAWAIRYGVGNCGEQSATAIIYLLTELEDKLIKAQYAIDWFCMDGGDHAFAVINRPDSSNEGKFKTWGPASVCDPWYNKAFRAADFNANLFFRKGTPSVMIRMEPGSNESKLIKWLFEKYSSLVPEDSPMYSSHLQSDKSSSLTIKNKAIENKKDVLNGIKTFDRKDLTPLQKPQKKEDHISKAIEAFIRQVRFDLQKTYEDGRVPSKEKVAIIYAIYELLEELEFVKNNDFKQLDHALIRKKKQAIQSNNRTHACKDIIQELKTLARNGINRFSGSKRLRAILIAIEQTYIPKLLNAIDNEN